MAEPTAIALHIYRYDADCGAPPRMQQLRVAPGFAGTMVLDLLTHVKHRIDDSVSFWRSCRKGVCGSDAMNINGKNRLACITTIAELPQPIVLRPLPGVPVVRDLVVDLSEFWK